MFLITLQYNEFLVFSNAHNSRVFNTVDVCRLSVVASDVGGRTTWLRHAVASVSFVPPTMVVILVGRKNGVISVAVTHGELNQDQC